MKIGYFDCFSGASGDMILGALIDAGVPVKRLNEVIEGMGLTGTKIRVKETERGHLRGIKADVVRSDGHHAHRTFTDIEALIRAANLPDPVKTSSTRVFRRLADVEGKLHGHPPDKVTFHEVGAIDSIVDVVCSVAGIEMLGLEKLYVSPFTLGAGMVKASHGLLPLPAPATLELLRDFEVVKTNVQGELLTPTGAAILTTLASQEIPPPFVCELVGYGAGTAQREELPNLLRLTVGHTSGAPAGSERDQVWVIETNVDDMTPELCGHLYDVLFASGAIDVYVTSTQMKKSRPGFLVTCLAPFGLDAKVEETLFRETTTFGIRKHRVERTKLQRESRTVRVRNGEVRVKVGRLGDNIITISPEYEDCRRIAESSGVPLKDVYAEASLLAREEMRKISPI